MLDLYDIHAKARTTAPVSSRSALLLRRFIEELSQGGFRTHRDLSWYAGKLFVTPEYLSEVCRKVSSRSAVYFIDLFTAGEIARLLLEKNVPVRRIAEDFSFSSPSYFTRYVVRHLGMTPVAFRKSRRRKNLPAPTAFVFRFAPTTRGRRIRLPLPARPSPAKGKTGELFLFLPVRLAGREPKGANPRRRIPLSNGLEDI